MKLDKESFRTWETVNADLFIALVRIYIGVGLFVKAISFMTERDYLERLLAEAGNLWVTPAAVLHYVIPVHLIGGALLALGLLTRVAALFQIPILLGASVHVFLPEMASIEMRQNLEFSTLVLFLLILFVIFGPGRWAVDNHLFKPRTRTREVEPEPAKASA